MSELLEISLDDLMPDPSQPRKTFVPEEIDRLAKSIKARGVLLPLRVLKDDMRGTWRIITGESRFRAAKIAGLPSVPCLPITTQPDESDLLADQIIENTCRHDLLPMELARSLAKLKSLKGVNSQTLAAELGISGSAITRAESLLSLPPTIQDMVDDGRMPESSAYEISRLPDEAGQLELAQQIVADKLNRDQVAEAVRKKVGKRQTAKKAGRLMCKVDSLSVTVSAGVPLTKDDLLKVSDHLRKEAKKLPGRPDAAEQVHPLEAS